MKFITVYMLYIKVLLSFTFVGLFDCNDEEQTIVCGSTET